jgi:hypothetical protein
MVKRLAFVLLLFAVALTTVLVTEFPGRSSTSTLSGTILDAQGNGVNGSVTFQLPVPAQDTATNTAISNTIVRYRIVNGVIQSGPPLYDVAGLQPANLYYVAKVFDSAGNLVLSGNYVVTGATFNFGAATPTSITTSNISYTNPVSPAANNVLTGNNTFSGTTTLALPLNLTQGGFTSQLAGSITGARTWTLQDTSDTFVYRTTADTLSNKTLTAPVINGASTGTGVQGTDAKLLTAGTISGTGVTICSDANGGVTTTSCPAGAVSEATWVSSQPTAPGGGAVAKAYAETLLPAAHTLTRFTVFLGANLTSCATTVPIVAFFDETASSALASISLTNTGSQFYDSGALSVAMTAAHIVSIRITTAGDGACTGGGPATWTVVYK